MNGQANVNAIDVLQDWHAALCVYRTEALEALASINLEIQRAEFWLDERLQFWQREARDADEDVIRCKAELANRRFPDFSGRIPDCSQQEENLWRAEARLEHAREQIDVVRHWYTKMPKLVEEAYSGSAHHLMNFLEGDLLRGLAQLKHQIRSLDAYVNLRTEHVVSRPVETPKEPT